MKFGLATSGTTNPKALEKIAIRADELGYDSFLVTDHFMSRRGGGTLDAWTFLTYVAAKTSNIRLGTCVTPIPFRPPAILAKMIATLDNISGGRTILGTGTGWYKPEFEGFSQWLEDRERMIATREGVELILKLWTEDIVDYSGKYFSAKQAVVDPKPVQKPHPPLWFGSSHPRSLRMCGRYGDGWLPVGPRWHGLSFPGPEKYAEMKETILPEIAKRNKKDFTFSLIIDLESSSVLRKDIDAYSKAGMNYFTLGLSTMKDESALFEIERVARDIGRSL